MKNFESDFKKYEAKFQTLGNVVSDFENNALMSLRIALISFFNTELGYSNRTFYKIIDEDHFEEINLSFAENYFASIIHFQHYFELTAKEILRRKNECLILDFKNNEFDLSELSNGFLKTSNENIWGGKTISFIDSCKRLQDCFKKNIIENNNVKEMDQYIKIFIFLNKIRNSLWHRGAILMNENDYDHFLVTYLIPTALDFIEFFYGEKYLKIWHYGLLNSDIDILEELNRLSIEGYTKEKTYILKCLGRAAYNARLSFTEKPSKHMPIIFKPEWDYSSWTKTCPVCGQDALRFYNFNPDDFLECFICKFQVDYHIFMNNQYFDKLNYLYQQTNS